MKNSRSYSLFLIFFLYPFLLFAASEEILPFVLPHPYQISSDPEPQGDFIKLVVPLKHIQNLLLIEAAINGVSGNFILDTGAPYLVLNKTYFRDKMSRTDLVSSGITGRGSDVGRTTIAKLQLQELYYENVEADIANLAQIENSKGVKVLGLLGTNLFTQFEFVIDVRRDMLQVYKLSKSGNRLFKEDTQANPDLQINIELINNIIFLEGKISEKALRFCFDSGAEVNVLSSSSNRKVISEFKVIRRSVLVGSGGQRAEVISGVVKQMELGNHTFVALQTYLTNLNDLKTAYATYLDGVLGYPLLFNGVVAINFKQKKFSMYFYKN